MHGLTSRPEAPLGSPDLTRLIEDSGVVVRIIEDMSVDPAMITIVREDALGEEEILLVKLAAHGISMYDVMKIVSQLGFHLRYEEFK